MITADEITRIIEEQHRIRASRFETGPHTDDRMRREVEDMLHLNDHLHDYAIGGEYALPEREAPIQNQTRRQDRSRVHTSTEATLEA